MKALVPCPSCGRHVRVSEEACPFCASVLPTDLAARAVPAATSRMKRAAAFAFTATLTLAGCSDDAAPKVDSGALTDAGPQSDSATPTDNGNVADTGVVVDAGDDGGLVALYGGPPDSGVRDAGGTVDDDGGAMALYGLPPADAGSADSSVNDDGGSAALYGLPPPDGGGGVRYGAPPPPDAADWV